MKNILLAKSNIRKNLGLSICISLLILISSMFICISAILVYDYQKNASKVAKSLNTSDSVVYTFGSSENISDNYIDSIMPDIVTSYEYTRHLNIQTPIEFNNGEVTPNVNIINSDSFKRTISRIEILEEDNSILDNYVYIPYHIHTGGGINIGDIYDIKLPNKTYKLTVKGYLNSIYAGSYNINKYELLVSDDMYNEMLNENPNMQAISIYINYKDGVDIDKESNKIVNEIYKDNNVYASTMNLDIVLSSRTFISTIFFVSFLLTAIVIILIIILMISNNISNYIRENIKTLGALKAMGYTSKDIRKSLLIQFSILTICGLILGILCGYLFMPLITNMLVAQSGIPYTVKFNLMATLVTFIIMPIVIFIIVRISARKINKVEPIVALKDALDVRNFKTNHMPLDKSKFGLNISLSIKNMYKNLKQNIISFITVIFLCFLMVIAMAMYQNFSRKPKLSLLTFEIVDGVIQIDKDYKEELENDLRNDPDITKYKYVAQLEIHDEDYIPFATYVLEDTSLINNQENCYKGSYPKKDSEIAISGKHAKARGYKIGDLIEFRVGDNTYKYKITGFTQTTNNNGHEVVLTLEGLKHLMNVDTIDPAYYFDSSVKASVIIDRYNEKYGNKVITTLNFEELIEGQMDTFINVANLMVVVISIITGCIIILVLYLLMKTLIYNRRYEYGILKAVGYRSRDLIIQNVLSFLPTIIIATIVGTIISYNVTNPYIGLMMRPFGIMKCNMDLPLDLMIFTVLFMVLTPLISTILMSLRIKKIVPCDLLTGE